MLVYVFQAALYCEDCGLALTSRMHTDKVVKTEDSDTYPQGPFNASEADSPQHCDRCGLFLENPLTNDGWQYLAAALDAKPPGAVVHQWAEFYGLDVRAQDAR